MQNADNGFGQEWQFLGGQRRPNYLLDAEADSIWPSGYTGDGVDISRRTLLASLSILPAIAAIPLPLVLTTVPVGAVEPATMIAAANIAVTALSGLLESPIPAMIDPVSRRYFEQLLDNQARISKQLADISAQIAHLGELITRIPPEVIRLDEAVTAKAVYHRVMDMKIRFLEALHEGGSGFDDIDRTNFTSELIAMGVSASEHLEIIRNVGQTVETIVAIQALNIALDAMVGAARIANFTKDGDKRLLQSNLTHITNSARDIMSGEFSPQLGSFVDERKNIRKEIDRAVNDLVGFREDHYYHIESEKTFYDNLSSIVLPNMYAKRYSPVEEDYYECWDDRFETSFNSYRDATDGLKAIDCRPTTGTFQKLFRDSLQLEKIKLRTPDNNSGHFILRIKPENSNSEYVKAMNSFNKAKVREQVYHSAEYVLQSILDDHERISTNIKGL